MVGALPDVSAVLIGIAVAGTHDGLDRHEFVIILTLETVPGAALRDFRRIALCPRTVLSCAS